jgi:hypothetical protein
LLGFIDAELGSAEAADRGRFRGDRRLAPLLSAIINEDKRIYPGS